MARTWTSVIHKGDSPVLKICESPPQITTSVSSSLLFFDAHLVKHGFFIYIFDNYFVSFKPCFSIILY